MSLSTKVALSIAAVVLAVGVAGLAFVIDRVGQEQRQDFRNTTVEALQLLGLSVAPALVAGHHDRAQAVLDNIANFPERFPDIESMEVVQRDGRVIADLDPRRFNVRYVPSAIRQDVGAREPRTRTVDGDTLRVVVPIRLLHPLGIIRARVSERRLHASLRRRQTEAVAGGLVAAALLAIGLYLLLRRFVSRRIALLAQTASQLRAGRMEVRAKVDGSDEIAELGDAFNRMAAELGAYTERLEGIVRERTQALEEANERLAHMAVTDELTSLFNRRHFEERANRDIEVARRAGRPFGLVIVDIDHFKSVNDRFGHPTGDRVLVAVARVLSEQARAADLVARIGGEEFAVAMPDTTADDAVHAAERMRAAIEALEDLAPGLEQEKVTGSFGAAAFPEHGGTLRALVTAADGALYRAKGAGRNRVARAGAGDGLASEHEA